MPELKMCPTCCLKHEVGLIYDPSNDKMFLDHDKLVYDVKFLCLKCDKIYQNSKPPNEFEITWIKLFGSNKIHP